MSGLTEIVSKHTICLVFLWFTFESIECPVGPIDVRLLQVADQIIPGDVLLVVAKLSQIVRVAESSHEGLGVEQLLLKVFVGNQVP